jgi:hypothetical protein
MAKKFVEPPKDTLGMATLKGLGVGGGLGIVATEGMPTVGAAALTAIGGVVGAGRQIVQSVRYANQEARAAKEAAATKAKVAEIRARHAATNDKQFKDF